MRAEAGRPILSHLLHSVVFAALFVAVPALAEAQQRGTVTGRIAGPEGNPIANASIQSPDRKHGTLSDQSGAFLLTNMPGGTHSLIVEYLGYRTDTVSVRIVPGQTTQAFIQMELAAVALPGISVQGQRGSQFSSINSQRVSPTVVNVVSADQIGQLPDQNVAEATQRLPGVYAQTDRGEGRTVSIRGTAPRLNTVTLDGQEMASAGNSRATQLDLLPADMVAGVEVVKVVTPDMDGGSVGGTINISSLSAFDVERPFLFASLEGMLHDQEVDYRNPKLPFEASFTAGKRFGAAERWGLTVGGNLSRRDFSVTGLSSNWWELEGHEGIFHPEDIEHQVEDNERVRWGVNSALDWRPSASTSLAIRGIFTRSNELTHNSEFQIAFEPDDVTDVSSAGAYYPEGQADLDLAVTDRKRSTYGLALDLSHRFGERLTWDFSAGGTRGTHDAKITDAAFNTTDGALAAARIDLSDFFFGIDYDNAAYVADPNSYVHRLVNYQVQNFVEDTWSASTSLRLDLPGALGFLEAGAKFLDRSKDIDYEHERAFSGGDCRLTSCDVISLEPFAIENRFGLPGGYDVYVQGRTRDIADFFHQHRFDGSTYERNEFLSQWKSHDRDACTAEQVTAGYLMGNVQTGGQSVLAGARVERTSTLSRRYNLGEETTGPHWNRTLVVTGPHSLEKTYTNVLPAVVLRQNVGDNLVLRAAWTNTIGRPDYRELSLNSYYTYSEDPGEPGSYRGSLTEGNPDLEPYLSTNWDATAEYYFNSGGLFSIAGFYKQIDNPIYTWEEVQRNVERDGLQFTRLAQSQDRNADEGTIRGVEFGWTQAFLFLPRPFDGLGVTANVSFIDSEVSVPGRDDELPFFGQANRVYNVIPYYQRGPLEMRLAWSRRSGYLADVGTAAHLDVYADAHGVIDFSTSYKVRTGTEIYFQARNLTNEAEVEYWHAANRIAEYFRSGRTFSLGLRLQR